MADIDLQRKRKGGLGWLWALLLLLLLALLIWWFWPDADDAVVVTPDDTEVIETVEEPVAPTLVAILENPSAWIDETFPWEVTVAEEMTDRGFWIEEDGARLFVVIVDHPQEEPKDINPGQTLRLTDGTLRSPDYIGQIPGAPLDADTESTAREQEVFMVVDEANIEILQGGQPQPGTDPAQGVAGDTAG